MELSQSGFQNTPVWHGVTQYFYTKHFPDRSPEILTEVTTVLGYSGVAVCIHSSRIFLFENLHRKYCVCVAYQEQQNLASAPPYYPEILIVSSCVKVQLTNL